MGAGGPVGRAFHAGLLRALHEVWDPRRADLIIGTSAGAIVGALLRGGVGAHDLHRVPDDHHALVAHINRLHPRGWPESALWVPALSLGGTRVVFGHPDAPAIDIGTAVRCSAAVPILRPPVRVGERRFIDGGIFSPTHLDLLRGARPRLVLVSSPLSRYWPLRLLLRAELRRHSCPVVLFEPDAEVRRAMPWNPMDRRRADAVADAAYRCARARLLNDASLRALLAAA